MNGGDRERPPQPVAGDPVRAIPVTGLGGSVEKVVATMAMPGGHRGGLLPEGGNALLSRPAPPRAVNPIAGGVSGKPATTSRSRRAGIMRRYPASRGAWELPDALEGMPTR